MKKLMSILLSAIIVMFSFSGCNKSEQSDFTQSENTTYGNLEITENKESSEIQQLQPSESPIYDDRNNKAKETSETITSYNSQITSSEINVTEQNEGSEMSPLSKYYLNSSDLIESGEMLEVKMANFFDGNEPKYKREIFDNNDELINFLLDSLGTDCSEEDLKSFYNYDDNFFNDRVLIFNSFHVASGSDYIDSNKAFVIKKDNTVTIIVYLYAPALSVAMDGYYYIFTEIKKSDISDLDSCNDVRLYSIYINELYDEYGDFNASLE